MLSKKQNLLETIRGGNPDRFVNSYEAFAMMAVNPFSASNSNPKKGELNVVNKWGVTRSFPDNTPGPFPVHDFEHIVVKDITKWKETVKAPSVLFPEEDWAPYVEQAMAIDRDEYFATAFVAPGIFEQCHYLMEMQRTLLNFYEEPELMHELIDFIADWEVQYAEQICKYLKPTALFHHDDWGSQKASFISPEMFEEFYVPAYKKVYGYYKEHGVELIVHHSDSYAANLVPGMIEMGIDIWQGAMSTNNIPELIQKYGGQISFMGGIDNGIVDREDWTQEHIDEVTLEVCKACGKLYFIPGTTMGGANSIYEGVYEAVTEAINKASAELF
ncbi:uroporphyrinogen decarboxylase [Alkalibacter rhizosphaerae]|uniref:Uroporphyrinogen decarboxylase n=1 Tax=Alkalibacter rhizosphaerae TaxID=2815577 RepID=A0A975AIJ9_9FIRM|nr:uroporphyrinogen decarboxylase family protein [Alkalibacter rhizosphaerae]QSX09158.1 uroporphyrinogen decarboxylase [Alkalibacter rhizosphaerae]